MNDHEQYEAWKAELYETLRDNIPEFAGKATGDGDFEKLRFAVGAAYEPEGKRGGMIVVITITDQDSPRKGKRTQLYPNWRTTTPRKWRETRSRLTLSFGNGRGCNSAPKAALTLGIQNELNQSLLRHAHNARGNDHAPPRMFTSGIRVRP